MIAVRSRNSFFNVLSIGAWRAHCEVNIDAGTGSIHSTTGTENCAGWERKNVSINGDLCK